MNKKKQELDANGVICNADGHKETFSSVLNLNMTPIPFFNKKKEKEKENVKHFSTFLLDFAWTKSTVVIVGGHFRRAVSTAECVHLRSVSGRKY